jgi:hypothetical protein
MFPIIETAIAFVAIMLAASLAVTAIVRLIHAARRTRSEGVPNMLIRLHHGFLVSHDQKCELGDAHERQFVADVLSSPVLHTTERYKELREAIHELTLDNPFVDPEEKHAKRHADEVKRYKAAYKKLSRSLEYLSEDDLLAIIEERSVEREVGGEKVQVIPGSWRDGLPDEEATTEIFADYVKRWFKTVEGTVAQQFGERARKLAISVSCLVVVLLNLDGLRLAQTLHQNRVLSESLVARVSLLQESADRLEVQEGSGLGSYGDELSPDQSWEDLKLDVQNAAAFMTNDALPLGWQNSYITKKWCAYRESCKSDTPVRLGSMAGQGALWILGLLFSCVLVSQGAPFWVNRLRELLRLKNAVQARKEDKSDKSKNYG